MLAPDDDYDDADADDDDDDEDDDDDDDVLDFEATRFKIDIHTLLFFKRTEDSLLNAKCKNICNVLRMFSSSEVANDFLRTLPRRSTILSLLGLFASFTNPFNNCLRPEELAANNSIDDKISTCDHLILKYVELSAIELAIDFLLHKVSCKHLQI